MTEVASTGVASPDHGQRRDGAHEYAFEQDS